MRPLPLQTCDDALVKTFTRLDLGTDAHKWQNFQSAKCAEPFNHCARAECAGPLHIQSLSAYNTITSCRKRRNEYTVRHEYTCDRDFGLRAPRSADQLGQSASYRPAARSRRGLRVLVSFKVGSSAVSCTTAAYSTAWTSKAGAASAFEKEFEDAAAQCTHETRIDSYREGKAENGRSLRQGGEGGSCR